MTKLERCPFCGGNILDVVEPKHPWDGYHVTCNDPWCLADGPRKQFESEAIQAWNRRAAEALSAPVTRTGMSW